MVIRSKGVRRAIIGGLAAVLVTAALSGSPTNAAPGKPGASPAACLNEQEAAFLKLINDYRRKNGVPAVAVSKALNEASYLHSKDMADNDYFDHDSEDGRSPQDRMEDRGYDTDTATGENIAAGYETAKKVFEAWRKSSGHNRNMLKRDYKVIGIGLAKNGSSEYGEYWTTDFGGDADAAPNCGSS
ncbi:CAP domain-containing protein [Actinokineospora sp.]|uniref:CAP domain-containing protein n=1 Tax=Actinokineospora sp. TaxID=1872133 RepID=UPI004037AE55